MSQRIVLRTGEALVEAEPAWSAAEPEVIIGELDWLLAHQDEVTHYFHQLGVDGRL